MSDTTQSFGQKAVGLSFNPSGDDAVGKCKQAFAEQIDTMHGMLGEGADGRTMKNYLADEAIGHMITAQMWAVKALTWKD